MKTVIFGEKKKSDQILLLVLPDCSLWFTPQAGAGEAEAVPLQYLYHLLLLYTVDIKETMSRVAGETEAVPLQCLNHLLLQYTVDIKGTVSQEKFSN